MMKPRKEQKLNGNSTDGFKLMDGLNWIGGGKNSITGNKDVDP